MPFLKNLFIRLLLLLAVLRLPAVRGLSPVAKSRLLSSCDLTASSLWWLFLAAEHRLHGEPSFSSTGLGVAAYFWLQRAWLQ